MTFAFNQRVVGFHEKLSSGIVNEAIELARRERKTRSYQESWNPEVQRLRRQEVTCWKRNYVCQHMQCGAA